MDRFSLVTLARFRDRHSALALIRYPLGRRAAELHDEYLESKRSETRWLIEQINMYCHIARKAAALFMLVPCLLFAQEPPLPPIPLSVQLRLLKPFNHYTMPVTVTVTQTITTVYELDYMCFIRTKLGTSNVVTMKTNYVVLETNILSRVTNSSPVVPE